MNNIKKADVEKIKTSHAALEQQKLNYNDLVTQLQNQIKDVITSFSEKHATEIETISNKYDAHQQQLNSLIDTQINKMEDYINDRSPQWQSSEPASKMNDWLDDWKDYQLEVSSELEFHYFEDIELLQAESITLPSIKR
ncbi:DNA-directed RNA polymerase subunit omega [Aliivibrio finisterrensis]|uniref:DNA-directed RNA polymerase subunit omega n=1 Tax=Aliivibrio finisterrensis TaxID=511998 RepID=A0ABY0I8N6_9GAMM|nr:DNA-directed RNA polymerase subunit omega [Aliivibrio finisterrensis]RYU64292.1 DNA-directed RNA polymerase subunit omega [Aliivibrio finisterrensis]RYU83904.1 DNA-directed RNA polymerase subunit omega [Aliivibrio finisterrensis]